MVVAPTDDDELLEIVQLVQLHGSKKKASEESGIPRSTLQRKYNAAAARGLTNVEPELPDFGDDDIPVEDIIDHMEARATAEKKYRDKHVWFPVKLKTNEPVLLAFVGDPHLGTHTDWQRLRHDIELMQNPGVCAVNIGDTANNWGYGYLLKKYADEDISRKTERKLAAWFLEQLPWIVWLEGNHDQMADAFMVHLRAINAKKIPMIDWRALFKLVFPNKTEIFIDAAHNHKGQSQYNQLHGQKKASLWTPGADIFCAGHHHNWALHTEEDHIGKVVHFGRCRGYKINDEYAHRWQFPENRHGHTISFFIDPTESDPTARIVGFSNLDRAVDYLNFRRSQ